MVDHKIPEDVETLTLIGGIVIWWGRIEGVLFSDLLALQHHPSVKASAKCDTLQIATKKLIKQWSQCCLLAQASNHSNEHITKLVADLRDTAEDRNVIVHGFWGYPGPSDPKPTRSTIIKPASDGKLLFAQYDHTPEKLHAVYSECFRLYHALIAVTLNHGFKSWQWATPPKADENDEKGVG